MIKIIGVSAMTALVIAASYSYVQTFLAEPIPGFASVDLNKLMTDRISQYQVLLEKGEIIPEGDAAAYGAAIDHAMKTISAEYGVIILNAPAVIEGVSDYTDKAKIIINTSMEKAVANVEPNSSSY